jgi:hypothetical protein
MARTEENTVLYRRNTLPEGEIRDWEMLAVLDQAVPLAMAGVFLKNAINWDLLVKDVSGAYDFWLSCLLVASRRPAYYIPQRLSKYRIHNLMETARWTAEKNENMVFIYGSLIEMELFPRFKVGLQQRYRNALFVCGKDYLYFDRIPEARQYFLRSLKISASAKAAVGILLTRLPKRFRTGWLTLQRVLHLLLAIWKR